MIIVDGIRKTALLGTVARAKALHPLADAFEDPYGDIETRLQRGAAPR